MRISDWSSDVCASDLHERHMRRMRGLLQDRHHAAHRMPDADAGQMGQRAELRMRAAVAQLRGERLVNIPVDRSQRIRRAQPARSEEHTSELQSLMRISYAVFCLKKKKTDMQQ